MPGRHPKEYVRFIDGRCVANARVRSQHRGRNSCTCDTRTRTHIRAQAHARKRARAPHTRKHAVRRMPLPFPALLHGHRSRARRKHRRCARCSQARAPARPTRRARARRARAPLTRPPQPPPPPEACHPSLRAFSRQVRGHGFRFRPEALKSPLLSRGNQDEFCHNKYLTCLKALIIHRLSYVRGSRSGCSTAHARSSARRQRDIPQARAVWWYVRFRSHRVFPRPARGPEPHPPGPLIPRPKKLPRNFFIRR